MVAKYGTRLLLATSLFLYACVGYGQASLIQDIPLVRSGDTLRCGWAGGLNAPQFGTIDLDNDGKKDLAVFDRDDNRLLTFRNEGTISSPDYRFDPSYIPYFPDTIDGWMALVDYNDDGYEDLFCGTGNSRVLLYKNTTGTSGSLGFVPVALPLNTDYGNTGAYTPTFSGKSDYPALLDVDKDGDVDLLTFSNFSAYVEFHENITVDSGYTADMIRFKMGSNCWGHFYEDNVTNGAYIDQAPCYPGEKTNGTDSLPVGGRHAGSTLLGLDLDGNTLNDLLVGDISFNDLYALYNNGSLAVAHIDSQMRMFPAYDVPVNLNLFPACFYFDANGDGVKDLICVPNDISTAKFYDQVWWYKNTNTNASPVFDFQDSTWLVQDMADFSTSSAVALFDHNGDGRLDLLVGNGYWENSPVKRGARVALWENTGTVTAPVFTQVNTDLTGYSGIPLLDSAFNVVPASGDLDNDGDPDLLIGLTDGTLVYSENTAGFGFPAVYATPIQNYAGIDAGSTAAPTLYDLDGDLDLDLFIGTSNGQISYYQNTGTISSPSFTLVDAQFGKIKVKDDDGLSFNVYVKPFFYDYDHDTAPELLVGNKKGNVEIYDLVTAVPGDSFWYSGALAAGLDIGAQSAITGARLKGGSTDYFILGTLRGGLMLTSSFFTALDDSFQTSATIKIFPNPGNGTFTVQSDGITPLRVITIRNSLGMVVAKPDATGSNVTLDMQSLPFGIYFVETEQFGFHHLLKYVKY